MSLYGIRDTASVSLPAVPVNRSVAPLNCVNCGAVLHGHVCEYCGTEYHHYEQHKTEGDLTFGRLIQKWESEHPVPHGIEIDEHTVRSLLAYLRERGNDDVDNLWTIWYSKSVHRNT